MWKWNVKFLALYVSEVKLKLVALNKNVPWRQSLSIKGRLSTMTTVYSQWWQLETGLTVCQDQESNIIQSAKSIVWSINRSCHQSFSQPIWSTFSCELPDLNRWQRTAAGPTVATRDIRAEGWYMPPSGAMLCDDTSTLTGGLFV